MEVQASVFIEMIAEIIQSDVLQSVIRAGNALADYVDAHGFYDEVEGERLVQEGLMKILTAEEQCRLNNAVNQYLKQLCELRTVQVRSRIDRACN